MDCLHDVILPIATGTVGSLIGSGLGIYGAFIVMNKTIRFEIDKERRDRKEERKRDEENRQHDAEKAAHIKADLKKRLATGLITELNALHKFCFDHQRITPGEPLNIETSIILGTVHEQLTLFDNEELVGLLFDLRLTVKGMNYFMSELSSLSWNEQTPRTGVLTSNWATFAHYGIHRIKPIIGLLESELKPNQK